MKEKIKVMIILIVLGLAFYWYEWRPSQARKYCQNVVKIYQGHCVMPCLSAEEVYQTCLRDRGLEK